jgi:hypothetical protein
MHRLGDVLTRAKVSPSALRLAFRKDTERWYRLAVPGVEAEATWRRLREEMPKKGYWPLLVGSDTDIEAIIRERECNKQSHAGLLRKARELEGEAWFDEMQKHTVKNLREALGRAKADQRKNPGSDDGECNYFRQRLARRGRYQGIPRGERPEEAPIKTRLVAVYNFQMDPLETVHLLLVPASQSWKVPVALHMGRWNECPSAPEHAAVLRFWEETYQAELIGLHNDILELKVRCPPRTWRQALQLARQQYIYCPDIVEQGTGDLDRLAGCLLNAPYWFFWWD